MVAITVDQFIDHVIAWAQDRAVQFKFNWPVKGGWEGWIQVDLTAYLLNIDSAYEILREQPIYADPRQRVDLLLNASMGGDCVIPVEIKAESFENRMGPFISGTKNDIRKLNDDRNTDYSETTCVMISIPFSQESLKAISEIEEDGHRIFRTIYVGEVAIAVAIYTEASGWLHDSNNVPLMRKGGFRSIA